jgi:hypothetical protein
MLGFGVPKLSHGFSDDGQKFRYEGVDDEGPVSGEPLKPPSCR